MAMEAQTCPSPPFPTADLGPCELSFSLSTHLSERSHLHYQQWVFWSTFCNDKVHCGKPPRVAATADDAVIKDEIKCFLQLLAEIERWRCLAQFWGIVKIGDRTYLTTCDQPFALCCPFDHPDAKNLCEYRKHCLEYLIPVDDDADDDDQVQLIIGPSGRVFRSGIPEYAPDVRDYTIREYPQRDYAVDRIGDYWALPVYHHPTQRGDRIGDYWALPVYHHPTQHLPSGVLEIVSPNSVPFCRYWTLKQLQNLPRELNWTATYASLLGVNSCQNGEIAKIEEALDKVIEICELSYYGGTETWTTFGEILSSREGKDFIRKGQGVVGRAFSSKRACFCRDIRQLSITEYPLVPFARFQRNSACFAVCLQSSCPNNCIYVLEFFPPTYAEDDDENVDQDEVDYGDPRTLLNSLMETLKEHLGSAFKIASGQELGHKLTVEVIKVSSENEFDSFEICNTTGIESTPRLGGDGMMQRG